MKDPRSPQPPEPAEVTRAERPGSGRLDGVDLARWIAIAGMLAAFVAYRGSWHAWETWGIVWELGPREEISGPVPTDDARWLLSSMSHTSTAPEVLGGTGQAGQAVRTSARPAACAAGRSRRRSSSVRC